MTNISGKRAHPAWSPAAVTVEPTPAETLHDDEPAGAIIIEWAFAQAYRTEASRRGQIHGKAGSRQSRRRSKSPQLHPGAWGPAPTPPTRAA